MVVDAKSGVSGAGRAATDKTHFVSADENVTPYGVAGHRHAPEIDQELAALGAAGPVTFIPHLLPLDQGELVSCYVTPAREIGGDELRGLFEDAYGAEPFVELADRAPGVREVRDTNICRISRHARRADREGSRVLLDRQPVEGRGVAGGPEPQPDVRPPGGGGDLVTFFGSRWVQQPGHVSEGAGLPAGFRAAGVRAGIKPSGEPDVGLLVSDAPETVSAARFTRSGVLAAPVLTCLERCDLDAPARRGRQRGQRERRHGPARARRRGQDAGRGGGRPAASRRGRSRSPRPA